MSQKNESGQVTLSRHPIHLNTMMTELYTMYRASLNDEIDLEVEKAFPDDDCMLYTDPDRLRQVINNLINKAVKFTQKGTITFGYRKNKKNG